MADIETVLSEAGRIYPNILALPASVKIGDLEVQTSLEEIYHDALQVTEHPVEAGASITDHSFKRPSELLLRCGWSNSSLSALASIAKGILSGFSNAKDTFVEGSNFKSDYVGGIYSQLVRLQHDRQPLTITTGLRIYDNMLLAGIGVTRDQRTSQILLVEAQFREVILVSTQSTTLPSKDDQANPESTAEVQNAGSKQPVEGSPSPGGALPIE